MENTIRIDGCADQQQRQTCNLPRAVVAAAIARALRNARPRLLVVARSLTGDTDAAEDLVQEAMIRALERFQFFAPDSRLEGWLLVVVRRLFIDEYRRRVRVARGWENEALEDIPAQEPEAIGEWESFTPADLARAVEGLSEKLRTVYALFAAGHSYGEIADHLGLRVTTVGTRLLRARRKLIGIMRAHASAAPTDQAPTATQRQLQPRAQAQVPIQVDEWELQPRAAA